MGWLSKLVGGSISEPIEAIGNIIDAVHSSDEEKAQAQALLEKIKQRPGLVQAEIGKVQAQHRSIFVAGARPFLMWVCGIGFLFAFLVDPLLQWLMPEVGAPQLPLDVMAELTIAMLGLSGLRTVEKLKGVSK